MAFPEKLSDILIAACTPAPLEFFFCSAEAIIQDCTICFFLLTRWQVIKRPAKPGLCEQSLALAVLINILLLACCFWRASAETDCQRHEVLVYWMGESKPLCGEVALTFTVPLIFFHAAPSACTSTEGPGLPHPVRPRALTWCASTADGVNHWPFHAQSLWNLVFQRKSGVVVAAAAMEKAQMHVQLCTRKLGNPSSVSLSGII